MSKTENLKQKQAEQSNPPVEFKDMSIEALELSLASLGEQRQRILDVQHEIQAELQHRRALETVAGMTTEQKAELYKALTVTDVGGVKTAEVFGKIGG